MTIEQMNHLIEMTEQIGDFVKSDEFLREDLRSQAILANSLTNLKEKRYVVSVIAAMKAGKSTTFNALLGRDLLPNENASCTAAVTEIKHAPESSVTVQKIYRDGHVVSISADANHTLEQQFHQDVRRSRAVNEVSQIEKYYLESPILAIEDTSYKDLVQNFILIDTPGPNEANIGDFDVSELQRIALEKLRDSDALIMLFDYQTYKSDTNATILRNIFENREDLEKDQEKIYFLINKIDVMSERDGTVEDVIENVKKLIKLYAPVIKTPQVFAFSAKQACLARSILGGNATEEARREMAKYASKYEEKIEFNGRMVTILPEPEDYATKLLEDSNIHHIEKSIIDTMFSQASVKLMENSFERIEQVISNIMNAVQTQLDISNRNGTELKEALEDSKTQIEELRKEGERLKEIPKKEISQLKDKINVILKEMVIQSKQIIDQYMTTDTIEGSDQNLLIEKVKSVQETIVQALQLMLNRQIDRIQRLVYEMQNEINQKLNKAFYELSEKATAIVGKKINMQFQVFRLGDLNQNLTSNLEVSQDYVNSKEQNTEGDPSNSMWKDVLKGAGIGFGSGIVLPGLGNLAGALMGGVVGLFKNLFSRPSTKQTIYTMNLAPVKQELNKYVHSHVDKLVKELTKDLQNSSDNYVKFVEGQLNLFIANLKFQLDAIMTEYQKNKGNLDKHVKQMSSILKQMKEFQKMVNGLKGNLPERQMVVSGMNEAGLK